ncbi:DUF3034 family protein [Pelomonas sp. KK5]|uniref:DUF3034 family protein n=1 Tax=Pelomonas sp. KK5 TaxID=1855730 RepID=UPI00097CA78E|nr:DUF3034 family protein [Pelomonas sp. KK5]
MRIRSRQIVHAALALAPAIAALPAWGGERLLGASGVSQVEGAAGGGLSPWALIAGQGSRDQVGASAFATRIHTRSGFVLDSAGAAVGLFDTVELSAARWRFGLGDLVPGQSLKMDVLGLKWRVFGDAVFDADNWMPQVTIGLQRKRNRDMTIPTLLGAERGSDTEPYVSAAKLWLGAAGGWNLFTNLTVRSTRASQFGLLGFNGSRKLTPELAVAVLPRDNLAIGVEYRAKPDGLASAPESHAADLFVAWWPQRHVSLTAAWLDLGTIAGQPGQRSSYVSLQVQF